LVGSVLGGLNEAANGFFTDSTSHIGTHTDEFFEGLARALSKAENDADVLKILADIKASLTGS
jgi:16S rRNA C1402 N4-methylase RsmH